ncbi:similar to Saccharomyces cerevisiae YNL124W NAF1 RNA-binding protein required for the assembly of box H/ACA snoRNPs and thus for pre-rRNA processing [Maudiozyma saulgeensis]|uniref:H/ACA ribonucleoprotein complex non-core subunit NAF1 n=1 Tax=Maudiozyma saulgeensis TaxID=1789683 RepID=A0A1X7QYA3_9SACH|nr:similar to Saccharomyces cerevisiae YNL124W NAF1 RNA-binding protein required for the assembly of box H/ACA snoRNPs and thus for pre-rRNA processing [Kazachstania saulgeensis]
MSDENLSNVVTDSIKSTLNEPSDIEIKNNDKAITEDEDLFSKTVDIATTGKNVEVHQALPHFTDNDINVDDISDSDSDSGSSSSSSSSSSSDESDGDEGDLEEEEDLEEETEGGDNDMGPIRSKNELLEEPVIEIPEDYKVKPNEKIQPLGTIKSIYENNIIVAATISGEQRVLKDGSIFCLENREVIGTLSEVFGPLTNPFYRICFKKEKQEQIENLVKDNMGSIVYYVVPEAHWVDTFELKRMKGTDASNGFDEELPESEQEFSDDEKEALFKKMKKDSKNKNKNKNKNQVNTDGNKRKNTTTTNNRNNSYNVQKPNNRGNNNNVKNYTSNRNNNNKYGDYPTMRLPVGMTTSSTTPSVHGYVSRTARQHTGMEQPQKPRQDNSMYDDDAYIAPKQKNQPQEFTREQPYAPSASLQQGNIYYNSSNQPHSNINYQQPNANMNYQQPNMTTNNNQYNPYAMSQMPQMPPQMGSMYPYQYYGNSQTQQPHNPQFQGNGQYGAQPSQPPQQNMDQVMQLHQLLMKQAQNSQGQHSQDPRSQQFPSQQGSNYGNQGPY